MEVPTGTSFFILLYSAAYKNKFVGAGFHPRPFIYKQQPRRGRPPGRPVLHLQTIILSFRANLWFAKNLITTQSKFICDSSLSLRNDSALLCVYVRPFINNKSVGAGFHTRQFIYKQQPRRGRPPGRPGCTDHNPVILRALPEESLLYNYRKIIFSATY